MANAAVEKAMQECRDAAVAATKRLEPKATKITVSIAHDRVIVDYFDKDGEAQRAVHNAAEIVEVQAEASTQIKHVRQGALT